MNKKELIDIIADELLLTKRNVNDVINSFCKLVATTLKEGDDVKLSGFGTFETRKRKVRKGVSPQNHKPIVIPSGKTIIFKPSKTLKNQVK